MDAIYFVKCIRCFIWHYHTAVDYDMVQGHTFDTISFFWQDLTSMTRNFPSSEPLSALHFYADLSLQKLKEKYSIYVPVCHTHPLSLKAYNPDPQPLSRSRNSRQHSPFPWATSNTFMLVTAIHFPLNSNCNLNDYKWQIMPNDFL